MDILTEEAVRSKKTSKLEAWFWSKVRNIFGDWCSDCGRPCGWDDNDQIHLCHRCYAELSERTAQCEHGKYLTEYCLPCGRINGSS